MKRDALIALAIGSVGAVWLFVRERERPTGSPILGSPIEGSARPQVTPHGRFGGPRVGPPRHRHQGIDLVAPAGALVLAVGDGVIVRATPGLGKVVRKLRLDEPGTWDVAHRRVDMIVYADLGSPLVKPGDRVRRGDPIARVDRTGFVHFAVKENSHERRSLL